MSLYTPMNPQNGVTPRSTGLFNYMEGGIEKASLRYCGSMSGTQAILTNNETLKFGTGSTGIWTGDATYANMEYVDTYNYGFVVPEFVTTAICSLQLDTSPGFSDELTLIVFGTGSQIYKSVTVHKTNPKISFIVSGRTSQEEFIRVSIHTFGSVTVYYNFTCFLY